MIEIRHLYKAFDNHMVLRNLNMKINDGAVYGFVGPNGAGKTTTMRINCRFAEGRQRTDSDRW